MKKRLFRIDVVLQRHLNIISRILNIMSRRRISPDSIHVSTCSQEGVQMLTLSFKESRESAESICAQIKKCVGVFKARIAEEQHLAAKRRRTLIHPGKYNPLRIHIKHSASSKHIRLTLPPHANFQEAIVTPLLQKGIENASINVLGGFFKSVCYCVAPRDPLKNAVIAYSDPIDAGAAYMVAGNATLGKSAKGDPLIHCHASICDQGNRPKGGHIIVDRCVIGQFPIFAYVTPLKEINVVQKLDAETNIPIFQPAVL